MNQKFTRKRLDILYDYKDSLLNFGLINLMAIALCFVFKFVIENNYYEISFFPFSSIAIIFIVSLMYTLRVCYTKNILLWISSLMICVYAMTLDEGIGLLITIFLTFSFLYEIVARFWLGIEIRFKLKELPWSFQKEKKE